MSSLIEDARDTAEHTASRAKDSAYEKISTIGAGLLKAVSLLHEMELRSTDALLSRVGLERKKSILRPVLFIAAGVVVGGGAALMLAPVTGPQLRKRIVKLFQKDIVEPAKDLVASATAAAKEEARTGNNGHTNERR